MSDPSPRLFKWVGSKHALADQIIPYIRPGGRYIEPFLGSGAVWLRLAYTGHFAATPAILADASYAVAECWLTIAGTERPYVTEILADMRLRYNEADPKGRAAIYRLTRERYNRGEGSEFYAWRAAAFLFMLHVSHGGLWRENKSGGYNVPLGHNGSGDSAVPVPCRYNVDQIATVAALIERCKPDIRHARYEWTISEARPGDTVYADPPYLPASETSLFTGYTGGWEAKSHAFLAQRLVSLPRGVNVITSNSETPTTRSLYPESAWHIFTTSRSGALNSDPSKRGRVHELIIVRKEGVGT